MSSGTFELKGDPSHADVGYGKMKNGVGQREAIRIVKPMSRVFVKHILNRVDDLVCEVCRSQSLYTTSLVPNKQTQHGMVHTYS